MARRVFEALLLLGAPVVVVTSVYLSTYLARRYAFPVGYDTPKYLWRASLIGAKGLGALANAAPPPFRANADRPGLLVVLDTTRSLLGVSAVRMFVVLPAVMAAVIGLGAAALARLGLDEPSWAMPVYAVAAGASVNVARMAGPGYTDNLVLTAVIVAAGAAALHAARGDPPSTRRTAAGAALLLAAGVLIHWVFVVAFGAILLGIALLSLPASVRAWRTDRRPLRTPSGRLVAIVGAGTAIGGLGLVTLLAAEPSPPRLPRESFLLKLRADFPRYAFPLVGPLAAIGVAALALLRGSRPVGDADPGTTRGVTPGRSTRWAEPDRMRGLWLLLLWAGAGAAAVLLLWAGAPAPAHRFVAFGLGLPLLVAAGLVGLARLCARSGAPVGRALGAVVVVAGLAGTTILAYRAWEGAHPWMPAPQVAQASAAGRYLRAIGGDAPVVFIVDLGGGSPAASTSEAFHVIRSALPPEVIPRSLVYLGDPEAFLRGEPTLDPGGAPSAPAFDQASLSHWPSVRAVLDQDPIALMMPATNRGFAEAVRAHPGWALTPTLAVVRGPQPGTMPGGPTGVPAPMTAVQLIGLTVAFLVVLCALGGGWAGVLVSAGWLERAALAPAFGIAVLVLGGVVGDRLGVPLTGGPAIALLLVLTAVGWGSFAVNRRGRDPR